MCAKIVSKPKIENTGNPRLEFYTYKGIPLDGTNEDGRVFVFTGKGSKQAVSSGGYYMLLDDLRMRLNPTTAAAVYRNDLERLEQWTPDAPVSYGAQRPVTIQNTKLPFPLWKDNGDPVNEAKPFRELLIRVDDTHIQFRNYVCTFIFPCICVK